MELFLRSGIDYEILDRTIFQKTIERARSYIRTVGPIGGELHKWLTAQIEEAVYTAMCGSEANVDLKDRRLCFDQKEIRKRDREKKKNRAVIDGNDIASLGAFLDGFS